MSSALVRFLQRQLDARGVTADQFAKQHKLNSSGLYQLLRGERIYVQDRTLERIAAALDMSLAEMIAAMNHPGAEVDPDEAEWMSMIRRVPVEKRPAARDMLLGLAIQPNTRGLSNQHRDGASIPGSRGRRVLDVKPRPTGETGTEGGLPRVYAHPAGILAAIQNYLRGWLQPSSPWRTAELAR